VDKVKKAEEVTGETKLNIVTRRKKQRLAMVAPVFHQSVEIGAKTCRTSRRWLTGRVCRARVMSRNSERS